MVLSDPQKWEIIMNLIVVGVSTFAIANIVNYILKRSFAKAHEAIKRHSKLLPESLKGDDRNALKMRLAKSKTRLVFFRRIIVTLIYIIGIVIIVSSIPELKTFSYSLLAGAGVAAIIIGFATQKTMANVVAGIMIAISQPFKIGDRIRFKDDYGVIDDITFRHTVLRTPDNRHLIIPNSLINDDTVQNYSFNDEKVLANVKFTIGYDSDLERARRIIKEEITKHPAFKKETKESELMSLKDPVKVRVTDLGDSGLELVGYYWVSSQAKAFVSSCDIREAVFKRFKKEKIEIPYPHRTIVNKRR